MSVQLPLFQVFLLPIDAVSKPFAAILRHLAAFISKTPPEASTFRKMKISTNMKKIVLTAVLASIALVNTHAQTVISLPDIKPASEVRDIADQAVYNDDAAESHVIWAAPGFKKDRIGAPVREQLFILEGKMRFTLDGKTQELAPGHWVILPANTPHTLEVIGSERVKLLSIQDKSSSEASTGQ